VHLPIIDFHIFDTKIVLDSYDLLMFTSKQAVVSIDTINHRWREVPSIAVGELTAKEIERLGGSVAYIAQKAYVKTFISEIAKRFKDKKILYLRPKKVSFDSKGFLASQDLMLYEEVIYETVCVSYRAEKKPQKNAVIIFTSPSTIECFLKNFGWEEGYHAVVIGEASKKHLPQYINVSIADEPSIESCIKKAKSLLQA